MAFSNAVVSNQQFHCAFYMRWHVYATLRLFNSQCKFWWNFIVCLFVCLFVCLIRGSGTLAVLYTRLSPGSKLINNSIVHFTWENMWIPCCPSLILSVGFRILLLKRRIFLMIIFNQNVHCALATVECVSYLTVHFAHSNNLIWIHRKLN